MKNTLRLVRPSTKKLFKDTRGANMVEYIVLVGVVALLAMAGFKIFGNAVKGKIGLQAAEVGKIK